MSISYYILTYGVALISVAFAALYFIFTRNFRHWEKKGVKYVKPTPFVGNMHEVAFMKKTLGLVTKDIYAKHKNEPYIGIFAFDEPILQIHDLDLVKTVLVKDFYNFSDRRQGVSNSVDTLTAKSLFGLEGERWKKSRSALSPSFTSGKMKRMYELIGECGRLLIATLQKEIIPGEPVDTYEVAARYTTDIIASCAFGIQGNTLADPNAEFRRKLRLNFEFSIIRSIAVVASFLSSKLVQMLRLRVVRPEVDQFIRATILATMEQRKSKNIKRNDILDSLIELKNSGRISEDGEDNSTKPVPKLIFDDEDICAHSFAFLSAGFETAATTISYMLFELALNPDCQDKLRKEVQRAPTDNGVLSYETIQGLKYLDMALQETLRKYPPLGFLNRISNSTYTLPGTQLTLEKDARVLIPTYGFHMDPDFFPNPKQFDPERFSDDNKTSIINYSYMPFGEGPRNCIGMRFALLQTKGAVGHLIKNFSVHPSHNMPKEIEFAPRTFLLQPKHKIKLIFKPL